MALKFVDGGGSIWTKDGQHTGRMGGVRGTDNKTKGGTNLTLVRNPRKAENERAPDLLLNLEIGLFKSKEGSKSAASGKLWIGDKAFVVFLSRGDKSKNQNAPDFRVSIAEEEGGEQGTFATEEVPF